MQSLINQVERVPIDSLTLHPQNARRGETGAIAASLSTNAQFAPIVVQASTRYVLSGNHTLKAARELGWTEIDAVIVDVDDKHAHKIMLAANRTADLGAYDNDALAELLSYLDGDYQGTGYTAEYVQALITPPAEDWEDAFDNLPDGDRQHITRTFTFSAEQAEIIDRAVETAVQHIDDTDGNRNGAALATICDTYNRSHA